MTRTIQRLLVKTLGLYCAVKAIQSLPAKTLALYCANTKIATALSPKFALE